MKLFFQPFDVLFMFDRWVLWRLGEDDVLYRSRCRGGGGWYWGHGEYIGPGIGEGAS